MHLESKKTKMKSLPFNPFIHRLSYWFILMDLFPKHNITVYIYYFVSCSFQSLWALFGCSSRT
jgi:hypothetical protein